MIDQIEALCRTLPKSVPKAARNGEIWRILNKVKGQDTGAVAKSSTFVRWMDLLFGSTTRDSDGRMTQIRRVHRESCLLSSIFAALIGSRTAFL
jgi:hypothetical protein